MPGERQTSMRPQNSWLASQTAVASVLNEPWLSGLSSLKVDIGLQRKREIVQH